MKYLVVALLLLAGCAPLERFAGNVREGGQEIVAVGKEQLVEFLNDPTPTQGFNSLSTIIGTVLSVGLFGVGASQVRDRNRRRRVEGEQKELRDQVSDLKSQVAQVEAKS